MQVKSDNFQVIISNEEFHRLQAEKAQISEALKKMKGENSTLREEVKYFSEKASKMGQQQQLNILLKQKIRILSKTVLRLGGRILKHSSESKVTNQEEVLPFQEFNKKHSPSRQDFSTGQMSKEDQSEERIPKTEDKKGEQQVQEQLNNIAKLTENQERIIQSWKLSSERVDKDNLIWNRLYREDSIFGLKQRIKKLVDELEEEKILLMNQRNIVQSFKKKLSDKEKDYIYLQKKFNEQNAEHVTKEGKMMKQFSAHKDVLKKEYEAKIKSILEFGSSLDMEKRIFELEREKKLIEQKLKQSTHENSSKQEAVKYMCSLIQNLKGLEGGSLEKAIEIEMGEVLSKSLKNRKEHFEMKSQELLERARIKLSQHRDILNT